MKVPHALLTNQQYLLVADEKLNSPRKRFERGLSCVVVPLILGESDSRGPIRKAALFPESGA